MNIVYIGQYTEGTTSRMRANVLSKYFTEADFFAVDTNIPFYEAGKIVRSIGFRFKKGPLIEKINSFILDKFPESDVFLTWIDKGVFIEPETLKRIRRKSQVLIHYTPDAAFYKNYSHLFVKGITYYDYLITTKSFEQSNYRQLVPGERLLQTTQGYDPQIHRSYDRFENKAEAVTFVGLCEPHRKSILRELLAEGLRVHLAGYGWNSFVKSHAQENLCFLGEKLVGEDYGKALSSSLFGLGLLSKEFPELHTTRTFEIPACSTALLTEENHETRGFYNEEEVIFYKDSKELVNKIKFYLSNKALLQRLTEVGGVKVKTYSYDKIIIELLDKIL